VLAHHERIDGKGYPGGLKGDQIPLLARMTAVADTFDALTSDRPYREGMPVDKALQIIEDAKGTQLCPECVALFMKWIDTNRHIVPFLHETELPYDVLIQQDALYQMMISQADFDTTFQWEDDFGLHV
jgi:HD-GYP domain-containing protein (c-di-GMP phosphodiesterase class II)